MTRSTRRNPVARARRAGTLKTRVIRPRKGPGSYRRQPKRKDA